MIIKGRTVSLLSCAAAVTGLLCCASCGNSGANIEDSASASAGATSTGDSTSAADTAEPPAKIPDCEGNVYVGRRIDDGTCGEFEGYQGSWLGTSLGAEGVLGSFCEYRWTPDGQSSPDLTALPGSVDGVESLAELCPRVIPQGDFFGADITLRTKIYDEFLANIGKPPAPMLAGPGLAPVDLRLIDTMPDGLLEKGLLPRSQHGLTLHKLARSILCVDGDCRANVYNHLGLPRIPELGEDRERGGFFGSFLDLAQGINEGVEQWKYGTPGARLILVLALGWEGIDEYGFAPLQGKSVQEIVSDPEIPADLQFVLASLARASCHGALSIAAAGNSDAEPCVQTGPVGPGFLEAIPAPDAATCEVLGFDHADAKWLGERPLVLAATHVTSDGGAHANARQGAQAPLAAQGAAFGAADDSSAMLIGSSVAALTVGATAAWVWSYFPELTPAEVRAIIYGSGTGLGTPAQFPNLEESRQVSILSALRAACLVSGGDCTDFQVWAGPPGPDPTIAAYVQGMLETPMLNTVVLGPDFMSNSTSPSACGDEITIWPQTDLPPLPPQPLPPWTTPAPGETGCSKCPVGILAGGKGLKVGLAFVQMMPFVGPIFIDVQTSTGLHRFAVAVEKLMFNPVDIVEILPPKDWGEIRRVSLGYVLAGSDGSQIFRSEPLLSYPLPCDGPPPLCYAPVVSEAQEGVGVCQPGIPSCSANGWTCGGGGVPTAEDCSTPALDEDCDGDTQPAHCVCVDGDAATCAFPPDIAWKAGKGICVETEQMCIDGQWESCTLNLPAAQEDCGTPDVDENCDGVVECGTGVLKLVAGDLHTCALTDDGAVRCWGLNTQGILGTGKGNFSEKVPPKAPINLGPGKRVVDIRASVERTCALLDTLDVMCWGEGLDGGLGYGDKNTVGLDNEPAIAGTIDVGGKVSKLAVGWGHTCALRVDGQVLCWGLGKAGRLGYGNTNTIGDDEIPASAGTLGLPAGIVDLVAGGSHTCALYGTGGVKCWGSGASGQLGYGNTEDIGDNETLEKLSDVPVGGKVVELTANLVHTCARLDSGLIRCWGDNAGGKLGYDPANLKIGDNETPASLPTIDLGVPALQITAGQDFTCARLVGDTAKCWGLNSDGQLGQGHKDPIVSNLADLPSIDLGDGVAVTDINAGWRHVCARTSGNTGKCWGDGGSYQLGNGLLVDVGDNPGELADEPGIQFPWKE
ncbi:MAG: hypothetical protein IPK80_07325 [Nannocystis sp.]|nr:hypothetical protein [Nannocystis sp.]